jgi:hypothetical protein
MNPPDMFCDHRNCPLRGQGNVIGHGHKEPRSRCLACGHAFAATQGTPF